MIFMSPFRGKAKQEQVCLTLYNFYNFYKNTNLSDSQLF